MINSASIARYPCLISFHLADTAGILFFGHVFTLAHQAFEQFVVNQLQCPWSTWFHNPDWIVPIKHAEAEYLIPLQAGREYDVNLMISHHSTSSFTLITNFQDQQKLCCTVKTVHVFCCRLTKQKISIPSFVKTFIEQIKPI